MALGTYQKTVTGAEVYHMQTPAAAGRMLACAIAILPSTAAAPQTIAATGFTEMTAYGGVPIICPFGF